MKRSEEAYEIGLGRRDAMNGVPFDGSWSKSRKLAWLARKKFEIEHCDLRGSLLGAGAGLFDDQPSKCSAPREVTA